MSEIVRLKMPVTSDELVNAINRAAKDMGWTANKHPITQHEFILGSLQERTVVAREELHLNGRILKAAELVGVYGELPISHFTLWQRSASDERIREFLGYVSQYLSEPNGQ